MEVISIFAELLSQIPDFHNCYYHIRFTGRNSDAKDLENIATLRSFDTDKASFGCGRIELDKFFDEFTQKSKSALVCACGSCGLLKEVKGECDRFGLRLRVEEI